MTKKLTDRQRENMLRDIVYEHGTGVADFGPAPPDPDPIGAFEATLIVAYRGWTAWDLEGRCIRLGLPSDASLDVDPGFYCLRVPKKDLPGKVAVHAVRGENMLTVWLEDGRAYVTDLSHSGMPFHRRHSWDLSLQQAEKNLVAIEATRQARAKAEQDEVIRRADQARESARLAGLEAKAEIAQAQERAKAINTRIAELEQLTQVEPKIEVAQ